MYNSVVALTRCSDYSRIKIAEAIAREFELLGGVEKFVKRGDKVLVKPNLIAPRPRSCATQTDPAVILETVRLLKDFGAKPFVGDSPAWGDVFGCVRQLELAEPLKKMAVPVRGLGRAKKCQVGLDGTRVGVSSVALEADVIVNLPKLKTHQQVVATFAVKNMFGCVSGKKKAYWHFARGGNADKFCKLLIEIYRFLNPAVTIIDGVVAMDGPGPIRGRARELGWLIGGTDPVACEVICSKLIGIEPQDVPIIKTAKRLGFGCSEIEGIKTVGDCLAEHICTDFKLAEPIPIRFSLPHVCKSICKQMLLLGQSGVKSITGCSAVRRPAE